MPLQANRSIARVAYSVNQVGPCPSVEVAARYSTATVKEGVNKETVRGSRWLCAQCTDSLRELAASGVCDVYMPGLYMLFKDFGYTILCLLVKTMLLYIYINMSPVHDAASAGWPCH